MASGCPAALAPEAAVAAGPLGNVVVATGATFATGAAVAIGGMTGPGTLGSGIAGSSIGATFATGEVAAMAGICPLGNVVEGPATGASSGSSISGGSDATG